MKTIFSLVILFTYIIPLQSQDNKLNRDEIILEGAKNLSDYIIGPEIIVTGTPGYYDYQTSGECRHYINRFNSSVLHAVYLSASDSLNPVGTRRMRYSFSSDDGITWFYLGTVQNTRSSYPSLTSTASGEAVIINISAPLNFLTSVLNIDLAPGAGNFTNISFPGRGFVFPIISRTSNNNFLCGGLTYIGAAPTDTVVSIVYNSASNTFSNYNYFYPPANSMLNSRITCATGPGGKALIIINPNEQWGKYSANRIFAYESKDNGITWGNPFVIFYPGVVGNDTILPFYGMDAIYDLAGNYYLAFNATAPSGLFSSAKLWVSKNGGTPYLVAQHSGINGIPEAANTPLHADAGIITIDHPSLSISSDGKKIFVSYSVQNQNDTLNGYNKCHIYFSEALTSDLNFNPPTRITNIGSNSFDERYTSLNQVSPVIGNGEVKAYLVYQKDSQPGSHVFNDGAPVSRSMLIFRTITIPSTTGIISNNTPASFKLYQNYPNPFNPLTNITFGLNTSSQVKIKIYDVTGVLLEVLADSKYIRGEHLVTWDASKYSSGIYFYTLEAITSDRDIFTDSKKMVLIK